MICMLLLLAQVLAIKEEFNKHSISGNSLKLFSKTLFFLQVSSERNSIGRDIKNRALAHESDHYMDDLLSEIRAALMENKPVTHALNAFF